MQRSGTRGRSRDKLEKLIEAVRSIPPGTLITAIKPVDETEARVSVRFGKLLRVTIAKRDAERLSLGVNSPWDSSRGDELADAVHADAARRWAVSSLNRRAQSSGQLTDKLVRRGTPIAIAKKVTAELIAIGALNDDAVAESAARTMVQRRPAGQRLIEAKLRAKRVDGETARRAASKAMEGRDSLADALVVARKHVRSMPAKLDMQARQRRLLGALARRGFDADVCREAVRKALKANIDE